MTREPGAHPPLWDMQGDPLARVASDFERDGFASGGLILDADEVAEINEEIERHAVPLLGTGLSSRSGRFFFADDVGKVPGRNHYRVSGLWHLSSPVRRLITTPAIHRTVALLTRSRTIQLWAEGVQWKPRRTGASMVWHQDAPYHVPVQPPERLITAWVALDDVDEESGCMWMVAGSHRWGIQEAYLQRLGDAPVPDDLRSLAPPPGLRDRAPEARAPQPRRARAGEVLFHHSLTWHRSGANLSDRHRRAISMFLMPEDIRTSGRPDPRISVPKGTLMTELRSTFPIVYPSDD